VRQILVNLLSNAVRFTEKGGRVTITCGRTRQPPRGAEIAPGDAWSFIRVEDPGVGMAPDQLDRIWDAFVQVDASRTRRFGGSGLGLTISRHLARLMRGDVTVTSQPGLGSAFTLWLPAADPADAVAAREGGAAIEAAATERRESPEAVLAASRQGALEGMEEVANGLMAEIERILVTYSARLRNDPGTPSAHDLGDAQLEDHSVTFLADVAQCLTVVGEDGPEAVQMLRDGSNIQRLIAVRHGIQRAHLGFSKAELRRDVEILREEVHAAIRRQVGRASVGDVEHALAIVNHFLDRAEQASLESWDGQKAESRE
jgi:hypothetical protein